MPVERAAERLFRSVADRLGDGGELGGAVPQQVGGELHPPLGQITHRRAAEQIAKPLVEHRARRGGAPGQFFHCPFRLRLGMDERQRPADHSVVIAASQPVSAAFCSL